ncbi:MAG: LPS export ABC transporter permease LptF [Proteobacteria bacterium]|nr:LPS export ABC transporter permease LptF [Pseudomonadota bacterium]
MGIIFRYITKELFTSLFGTLMVLLIIFMSNQFVHFLQFAASGHITMSAVMRLMSLQAPFLLGYLTPLAMYLSILLVFGRLYLDHEMTVMSACGVGPGSFLSVVLTVGIIVSLVVGFLMLWLEPFLDTQRIKIFYESVANTTVEKVMPKRFQTLGNDLVFYADNVERGRLSMSNIFFAQRAKPRADGSRPWDITVAKQAQETYINNNRFISFKDGYRYSGASGEPNFQIIQYQEYGVRLAQELPTHSGWPSNASTAELWPLRHDPAVAAELHWRMAMPLSAFVLALLAYPLSRVNPRRGKFSQLIPAILLYIIYGNFLFLGRAWIRKGLLSFGIGLWWLHGAMALVALSLLLYRKFKNAYS